MSFFGTSHTRILAETTAALYAQHIKECSDRYAGILAAVDKINGLIVKMLLAVIGFAAIVVVDILHSRGIF